MIGRALFQLNDTMYYILTSFYSYKPPRKKILSWMTFIIQFTFNIVLCYDATRGFYPLKYANVYSCVCKNNK